MKVWVKLTETEMREAAYAGVERRLNGLFSGRGTFSNRGMSEAEQLWWQTTCVGALGEYAVCKALDMDFSGAVKTGIRALNDAGNYEVRTTWRHDGMGLIVKDKDTNPLILCEYEANFVLIVGWVTADYAKLNAVDKGGFRVVPRDLLWPITDLPEQIVWSESVYPKQEKDVRHA